MEEVLMKNDYIEQVCVAGLGIPQPIALVNLSEVGLAADKTAMETSFKETMQKVNRDRAKFEQISTIIVQNEIWSEDNGLLTPTLKVKRGQIDDRYLENYLAWHEAAEKVIWA